MASSRPSPVRSRTTQAGSSTVPLVLPSDGTICNSFLNCFRSKTSLLCPRYNLAVGVPIEVTAATILLTFWDTNIKHIPLYTAILIVSFFFRYDGPESANNTHNRQVLTSVVNILGVRWFGESEFVFAIIKISLITGLIICGLGTSRSRTKVLSIYLIAPSYSYRSRRGPKS